MNHINNITNLEKEIIDLLSLALRQPFSIENYMDHPIRSIEASKSLIGLNLNEPNKNIINFLNSIQLDQIPSKEVKIEAKKHETVSIYELEDAINNSDSIKINDILDNILDLSDGRHVLEFLVELSLRQTGKSLKIIWPIFKAMNFIGYNNRSDIRNSIDMACKLLMFDDFQDTSKGKSISIDQISIDDSLTLDQLQTIGIVYEISNLILVRQDLILENLSLFLNHLFIDLDKSDSNRNKVKSERLGERVNLIRIIDSLTLSRDVTLYLNAIRSIIKYSKRVNSDSITYYINKLKEINS
jgi:hypothetical protein